jgi:hypothetical protein
VTAPLHISPAILEFQEQQTGERRISLLELEISAKDREISDKDRRIKALENLLAKFAARIDELEGRCPHLSTNGDNYGESCALCGKQLKGYGFGGWFGSNLDGTQTCIHDFIDLFPGTAEKVCRFCEKQEES